MRKKYLILKKLTALLLVTTLTATTVRAEEYGTFVQRIVQQAETAEQEKTEAGTENTYEAAGTEQTSEETESVEAYALAEDESLREEYVKHFIMSDGSMKAVVYSEPVHYEENGVYKDIDSTLVEVELSGETDDNQTEQVENKHAEEIYYKNRAGETDIYLSDNAGSDKLAKIKKGKYSISFSYLPEVADATCFSEELEEILSGITNKPIKTGFQAVKEKILKYENTYDNPTTEKGIETVREILGKIKGTITNPEKETSSLIDKAASKTGSSIKYKGIKKDTDIEYVISGAGLKENIKVYSVQDKYEYSFVLKADNLILTKNIDGSITASDENTGEEIFVLPAPFMYDSEGTYSDEVSQDITINTDGTYKITIKADKNWINSEERSFPVTIDPVIITETTKSAIDTTLYGNCRILVKFTLPTLQNGDMIVSGKLHMLNYKNGFYSSGTPDLRIDAHMVTGSWSMGSVTWKTQPTYDGTISDFNYLKRSESGGAWKTFDLTGIVKRWYEGTANNGILIKSSRESGSYATSGVKGYFWPERYNSEDELYPRYLITYRNNRDLKTIGVIPL